MSQSARYRISALDVYVLKHLRDQIIAKGGQKYIDTESSRSVDHTWQMWMHDPDCNKFKIMEYMLGWIIYTLFLFFSVVPISILMGYPEFPSIIRIIRSAAVSPMNCFGT